MAKPSSTKPKAVALRYDKRRDEAPRVTAKGQGFIAEQIIEIAREAGIHIRQDQSLVEVLSQLELDSPIPTEAFAAVAAILNYVYSQEKRTPGGPREA
jgi:flagellar biosynthesis protein